MFVSVDAQTSAMGEQISRAIALDGVGTAAVALGTVFTSIGNFVRRREKGLVDFDIRDRIFAAYRFRPAGIRSASAHKAPSFREQHGAILIGMRPAGNALNSGSILNPPFHTVVEGGMFLDYISGSPLKIDWVEMHGLADTDS